MGDEARGGETQSLLPYAPSLRGYASASIFSPASMTSSMAPR